MSNLKYAAIVAALATAVSLAACSEDEPEGSNDTGSGAGSSDGGSTGTSMGGSSGDGGGTTGAGGSTESPGGFCVQSCDTEADCCAGNPACPGSDYPNNPTCQDSVCVGAQCSTTDDCTFGGALPGYDCLVLDGFDGGDFHACLPICDTDAECTSPATCIGEDNNGTKYCTTEATGGGCTADSDCGGYGVCDVDSGACYCDDDNQCTATGVDSCHM